MVSRKRVAAMQEWALYGLLLLLPFAIAGIEIAFGFLLIGWLLLRFHPALKADSLWLGRRWRAIAISGGIYFFVCALSVFMSAHVETSLSGLIGKWGKYLMMMVVAADLGARPKVVERSTAVFAVSSALVVIEAVTQEIFGRGLFRGHSLAQYGRMSGPYTNPIDLATYLMVVLPILACSLQQRRKAWLRGCWALLIVALLLCFARTEAFGTWVSLIIAMLLVMLITPTLQFRRLGLAIVVLVAALGLIALRSTGRLGLTFSASDAGRGDRIVMWKAAAGMIHDSPVLGLGINTFMANYLNYWVGGERQPRYAHNCYLQVAAETGILGLAAFLCFLGMLCKRFWGALGNKKRDVFVYSGWCIGLFAFLLHAGIDTNFYSLRQSALFWVVAGLALGFCERSQLSRQL